MAKTCDKTTDLFETLLDGKQLKAIIKGKGWTQKEVAEYWGFTEKWVSQLITNNKGQRSRRDDCAFEGLPQRK